MSSILQIYLLRTCMYVCRTVVWVLGGCMGIHTTHIRMLVSRHYATEIAMVPSKIFILHDCASR